MPKPELRKQTTTLSARLLQQRLEAEGYRAEYHQGQRPPVKPTAKAAVKAAEAIFGRGVKTFGGGHTVVMSFNNISVEVPVQHMIGHGALAAIEKKTGLVFGA